MSKGKGSRSLYLPAWSIVAAVVTLLLVIAVSTYRNMSRETGRMEDSLLREGLVIIRAIEAGVRADFGAAIPDVQRLQKLITEVAREPEVASIVIFDQQGKIVAASPAAAMAGRTIREAASLGLLLREKGVVTRYRPPAAGEANAFEIILPFRPFTYGAPSLLSDGRDRAADAAEAPLRLWAGDKMIGLGLKLASFETARQQDRHHTLLMAAILVVLGAGALYFIFVVQNYYLVNRTLGRMRSYTENVVESMADGLISVDQDGRIVTLNRQAAEILGSAREALEGRKFTEIMGEGSGALLSATGGATALWNREIELKGKAEGIIPLSVSVAPLLDEAGREMGAVLLIRDLREIRALQEKVDRSERLASLGRLAAGMAHEIRNPLSSIRGFAQFFLKRFSDKDEEREYAAIMVKEVDRLNRVITDLLDFARPKEPHRESQELAPIADHALSILASDLAARKVAVVRLFTADLPPLPVDRDQILRLFINLFLNAAESMEAGGELTIGLDRRTSPEGIEITVSDTGTGIAPEDRDRIFEPFFSRKRKGTGLGLAIVHQIVEAHQGTITLESRPEPGTTFRIRLPLGESADMKQV